MVTIKTDADANWDDWDDYIMSLTPKSRSELQSLSQFPEHDPFNVGDLVIIDDSMTQLLGSFETLAFPEIWLGRLESVVITPITGSFWFAHYATLHPVHGVRKHNKDQTGQFCLLSEFEHK